MGSNLSTGYAVISIAAMVSVHLRHLLWDSAKSITVRYGAKPVLLKLKVPIFQAYIERKSIFGLLL